MPTNPYNENLDKNPANYQPLTPLQFLARAAAIYPDHTAIIHGNSRISYGEFYARCRRLASALRGLGIGVGDTVSVVLANTPSMLEAHFGVPMAGAVLHSINTRLDAPIVAFQLDHADAKVVIRAAHERAGWWRVFDWTIDPHPAIEEWRRARRERGMADPLCAAGAALDLHAG
jgi:fatty-acyl-CoA synthase